MPLTRITFCAVVARVYSRFSRPRNVSLNWFIPALVNSSVGSSAGTSGELGTILWPFFSKYLRNDERISFAVIVSFYKTRLGAAQTSAAVSTGGRRPSMSVNP